jgi:hypothetical protein
MTQPTSAKSDNDNKVEILAQSEQPKRKSILLFALFALMLNGAAAVSTLPSFNIALPDIGAYVAELLPHEKASAPIPEAVVATLKDIQSAQQQHATALEGNGSLLQQNAALLQQDTATLDSLRKSMTDEQSDVKRISTQLSSLIAKVDLLQNALAPEITSSISKGRARARLSAMARKRVARPLKPAGPISVGGAPLTTTPAQTWNPQQSPEG